MLDVYRISLRLIRHKGGSLSMMLALLLPVALGVIAITYDAINLRNYQAAIENGLDAASLAGVTAMAAKQKDTTSVQPYAVAFLAAQLGGEMTATELAELKSNANVAATATTNGTSKTYGLRISSRVSVPLTPFARFLGWSSMVVGSSSNTSSTVQGTALSAYLVVDRSGSMSFVTDTTLTSPAACQNYTVNNWNRYPNLQSSSPCHLNKIAALKQAASSLFTELDAIENSDTLNTIVRAGTVSFTDALQAPSDLAWGTTNSRTYITALPAYPTGGTDMTDGMATAYNALIAASETTAHLSKNNTTVQKFIILMTDGENTGASSQWKPALDAETLATCTAAKNAGITIFTVAFMAPANGQILLQSCAGSNSNYFAAENAAQLNSAFQSIAGKISSRATKITQ